MDLRKILTTYLIIFAALNFAFIAPHVVKNKNSISDVKTIGWSEHDPLKWSDFEGRALKKTSISALTASAIEYSYDCTGNKVDLYAKAIFIPEESWVKESDASQYILKHEQLHFDITEVYARKLRMELIKHIDDCDDIHKIDRVANRVLDEWKREQSKYDAQTKHSIDRETQQLWHKKVASDLLTYEDYDFNSWTTSN